MRPESAESILRPRAKALVLGAPAVARFIAAGLKAEGFDPVLQADDLELPLPVPADNEALTCLKQILHRFKERAGRSIPPYSHCVHPGNTAWASRPDLAWSCQELGLGLISPPVRVMSLFGNRLNLLSEAEKLGIPHLVLNFDPISSVREVENMLLRGMEGSAAAPSVSSRKFPLVLKSVKGGGDFGLCVLHSPEDLERRLPLWLEQLRRYHGEVILYPERYLEGSRKITVPFVRFMDGRIKFFPLVDASLQFRNRKIIEFCPAPSVDGRVESQLQEWTERLAAQCNYLGVGSLDFLIDSTRAFLLEGFPGIESSFHLWEKVAGTNAVAWQLSAFESNAPRNLPVERPEREWGSALSVALYAEDSLLQLPQPGVIREVSEKRHWKLPGAAAELNLSVEAGTVVDPMGDGQLGMLYVGAHERDQALMVARGVLDEIWISGTLQTNERFIAELLVHPWIREGMFHAGFLDEEFIPEVRPAEELIHLFVAVCQILSPGEGARWAVGDQWVKPPTAGPSWVSGPQIWRSEGLSGLSGVVELSDHRKLKVSACPLLPGRWKVRIGSWVMSVRKVTATPSERKKAPQKLMALVPGRVHAILYQPGSLVPAHEPIVVVESLRVLVPHALPCDVRLLDWNIEPEAHVVAGQELAGVEISSHASEGI